MTHLSAPLRNLLDKLRKLPLEQRLLTAVCAAFLVAAVSKAAFFYFFNGLPGLYAKDLGVNYIVSEYIRHSVHNPQDFIDMLGWNMWWD